MEVCPTLKEVVGSLQCEKTTIRLLKLKPGSIIKEHTDKGLNFEEGEARIHVPIFTNAGVEFYLGGEKMELQEGECWYMNFNLKHRIANNSNEDRVHLVIDCQVNGWMAQLFDSCSSKCMAQKDEQFSNNEKLAIIENLKAMGTPESLRIAEEFFKSLA
jgi:mannose-6-phosphate isomerase-like protein (cupin superfamily)